MEFIELYRGNVVRVDQIKQVYVKNVFNPFSSKPIHGLYVEVEGRTGSVLFKESEDLDEILKEYDNFVKNYLQIAKTVI